MTCGVCGPKAFRTKGKRIYGYLVADSMTKATVEARKLYYLGAEVVLSDKPEGRVCDREGFKTLMHPVYLRSGDLLILSDMSALGSRKERQDANAAKIETMGVEISIIRPDYFESQSD